MLDTRVIGRDKQLAYASYAGTDGSFNSAAWRARSTRIWWCWPATRATPGPATWSTSTVSTVQAKTYTASIGKTLRMLPGAANRKIVAV